MKIKAVIPNYGVDALERVFRASIEAVKAADTDVALGLSHSRKAYFYPRPKKRVCAPLIPQKAYS
jgi:hypothetical protein